jgi:hypothetical protein
MNFIPLSYSSLKKLKICLIFSRWGAFAVRANLNRRYIGRKKTTPWWSACGLIHRTAGIVWRPRGRLIRRKEESFKRWADCRCFYQPDRCRWAPAWPVHQKKLYSRIGTRFSNFIVVFAVRINARPPCFAAETEIEHFTDVSMEK